MPGSLDAFFFNHRRSLFLLIRTFWWHGILVTCEYYRILMCTISDTCYNQQELGDDFMAVFVSLRNCRYTILLLLMGIVSFSLVNVLWQDNRTLCLRRYSNFSSRRRQEKLFTSVFAGRCDVYAKSFINDQGKFYFILWLWLEVAHSKVSFIDEPVLKFISWGDIIGIFPMQFRWYYFCTDGMKIGKKWIIHRIARNTR